MVSGTCQAELLNGQFSAPKHYVTPPACVNMWGGRVSSHDKHRCDNKN